MFKFILVTYLADFGFLQISRAAKLTVDGLLFAFIDASLLSAYFTNIFVILIWGSFVWACFSIWRYRSSLIENEINLKTAEKNAANIIGHNQEKSATIRSDLLDKVDSKSLIAKRINDLEMMFRHSGNSDVTLLADNLLARELSKLSLVRYVASVLVLLGLCGAIYGLSDIVLKMGPELRHVQQVSQEISESQTDEKGQNTSLAKVQSSIGTLVNGMADSLESTQGAFAASLTGIICSVFILFFNWWIGKKQSLFLSDLEDVTVKYLIPLFQPAPATFQLIEATDSFKIGAEQAATLALRLDHIADQTNNSLANIFQVIRKFDEVGSIFKTSNLNITETQGKMLELAGQFTGLTELVEKHQTISKEEIANVVRSVELNNQNINNVLAEWRKKHEEGLEIIEKAFRLSDEKYLDIQKKSVTEMGLFRAQMHENLEKVQTQGQDQIKSMLTEQKQYIDNLSDTLINAQEYKQIAKQLNEFFKAEREDFSGKIKEILELQSQTIIKEREEMIKHLASFTDGLKSLDSARNSPNEISFDYEPLLKANQKILEQQRMNTKTAELQHGNSEKITKITLVAISVLVFFGVFILSEKLCKAFGLIEDLSAISSFLILALSGIVSAGLYILLSNED